ncbi:hypothetical protein [Nitrosomonas sp. Nm51]|uniref:hypothetical protein n=1 Tax=Nitrosomonas sp. Nm51 TaxID=133720 RepID=UPI0015A6190B|nr:hypothetical protein [Nitrosomonas sp. Nm51]
MTLLIRLAGLSFSSVQAGFGEPRLGMAGGLTRTTGFSFVLSGPAVDGDTENSSTGYGL